MDTSYTIVNFLETLIKAGRADSNALDLFYNEQDDKNKQARQVDFNAPNNSTMDLREYGIVGNWELFEKYDNQQAKVYNL